MTRGLQVVLITGPPGAGKTTVSTALMGLLEAEDARYAALEVEALALVHPPPDDDAAFAHLALLAGSSQRRGYSTLLVTATIEDGEYLRRLLDALPSDDVLLVRLEAPPPLLRERLNRREPPDWVGLPALLDATGRLATSIAALPGVDLALSTVDADPRVAAATIREAMRAGGG
jgi:energy-coupling factor transporter ATP-binding protein EcfA2